MTKDIIEAHLEQGLEKLKEVQSLPYIDRGILFHEALAFLCACEAIKPTLIIDSGVAGGRSLDIWATAYPNTRIIALDKATDKSDPDMRPMVERIKRYSNVELRQGVDSFIELPAILQNLDKDERVVICIDGPKYTAAVRLAAQLIKTSQVKAIGIHDMCEHGFDPDGTSRYHGMDRQFKNVFYTDEPGWLKRFGGKFEDPAVLSPYPWWPTGPGMSVYVKS
jgi:hypothetical protein